MNHFQKHLRIYIVAVVALVVLAGAGFVIKHTFFPPSLVIHVPRDYDSISEAVKAASSGSDILISEGVYEDGVTVDGKRLTLRANPVGAKVSIDTIGVPLESINGASVTVKGLELIARSAANNGGHAAATRSGGSLTLENCSVVGSYLGGWGMRIEECRELVLKNCKVYGGHGASGVAQVRSGGVGIVALDCKRMLIENTEITGGQGGSATYTVGSVRFSNIQRYAPPGRGGYGVWFRECLEVTIRDSVIRSGDGGDGIMGVAPNERFEQSESSDGGWGAIALVARDDTEVTATNVTLIAGRGGRSGGLSSTTGQDGMELYVVNGATYNGRTGDMTAWIMD